MSAVPILDAERLIVVAIRDALAPVAGTWQGLAQVYYQIAPQGAPMPLLVYQFQAAIGQARYLDRLGSSALVAVKALAVSADAARDLLLVAAGRMASLHGAGVTITAVYDSAPTVPPLDGVYQAIHLWRITVL